MFSTPILVATPKAETVRNLQGGSLRQFPFLCTCLIVNISLCHDNLIGHVP